MQCFSCFLLSCVDDKLVLIPYAVLCCIIPPFLSSVGVVFFYYFTHLLWHCRLDLETDFLHPRGSERASRLEQIQMSTTDPKPRKQKQKEPKSQPALNGTERLKTVVRRLPPNLPEEIFWQSVQAWVTDEAVTWKSYHPGKLRTKRCVHARVR